MVVEQRRREEEKERRNPYSGGAVGAWWRGEVALRRGGERWRWHSFLAFSSSVPRCRSEERERNGRNSDGTKRP